MKKKTLVGYLGSKWFSTFKFGKDGIVKDAVELQLELHKEPAPEPREQKVRITIEGIK